MREQAIFELDRGFTGPRDIICKTVVHRPRREIGFPLISGVVYGLLALGLLTAVVVTGLTLSGALILVGLELVIGLGLGWLAVAMLGEAIGARRFNRRGYEVRFELTRIEIRSVDGVEVVALADLPSHPFLQALPFDWRIRKLMRARAACERLAPQSEVRVVIETLALLESEDEEESLDGPPPARPLHAIIVGPGQVNFFQGDEEDLADARDSGLPVYRVATDWDPEARAHVPRLTPSAVVRIDGSAT